MNSAKAPLGLAPSLLDNTSSCKCGGRYRGGEGLRVVSLEAGEVAASEVGGFGDGEEGDEMESS